MADEPTWDDLFGEELPPKPATPVTPPVQPVPSVPAAPVQAPSIQSVPTSPPPVQAPQVQTVPSVPPPAQVPPLQVPPVQSVPTSPPPASPGYPTVPQVGATQPAGTAYQPTYTAPQQPTYASTLRAPTQAPPAAGSASQQSARSDAARRGGSGRGGSGRGGYQPIKPKRKLTWLWILVVLVVLGGGGAGIVYAAFGPQIRHVMGWEPSIDYSGTGNGQAATITIVPGQIGSDVANSLAKAGVTKTPAAFYDLLLKQKKAPNFEPGTYKLQKQMSAQAALTALTNPANRVVSKVVIPEGSTVAQIVARLSAKTGVKLADLQAVVADYKQFKLPPHSPSLEGYLFPATYEFDPGTTALQEIKAMVTRMNQAMAQHKVPAASELKVLTLASIIQKEGANTTDFYKVSRVFTNRLSKNMALQSDATVSYGAGSKSIETTPAQRADKSDKYNTYAHTGLPVGPISSPGDAAIDAALHPVAGPWLYFVLVNGYTGKTVFSTTQAGQDAAVKLWDAWLKAHPGYGKG